LNFVDIFRKTIKYHGNPSSGSRDAPCGRTDTHYDIKVVFLKFVNAPSIGSYSCLMLGNLFRRSADN